MNLPDITKLTALAATLAGKQIRLNGVTLNIHTMAINDNGQRPRLLIETSLESPEPCTDSACDCPVCAMSRAIPKRLANEVIALLCQGMSDSLMLDSSFVSEEGFHVKLRNLHTGASTVSTGGNLPIAIGQAVASALAS